MSSQKPQENQEFNYTTKCFSFLQQNQQPKTAMGTAHIVQYN